MLFQTYRPSQVRLHIEFHADENKAMRDRQYNIVSIYNDSIYNSPRCMSFLVFNFYNSQLSKQFR